MLCNDLIMKIQVLQYYSMNIKGILLFFVESKLLSVSVSPQIPFDVPFSIYCKCLKDCVGGEKANTKFLCDFPRVLTASSSALLSSAVSLMTATLTINSTRETTTVVKKKL